MFFLVNGMSAFALLLAAESALALDLHDVNIFVVTDTHSWMDAHRHLDSEPATDATYGNLTSFVTSMKEYAATVKKDIFFLDNGDVVDGTGLSNASPVDGEALFPLLMKVPFDAMAIGNHECYDGDTIKAMISTDYIASRKGAYLTSNVLLSSTMEPLGSRYVVLEGPNSGVRLLVLGVLYNVGF
jgi:2',3'-cyclic-nucleotide 2'-phosphodiesterase (5'-nucleotidase family)